MNSMVECSSIDSRLFWLIRGKDFNGRAGESTDEGEIAGRSPRSGAVWFRSGAVWFRDAISFDRCAAGDDEYTNADAGGVDDDDDE